MNGVHFQTKIWTGDNEVNLWCEARVYLPRFPAKDDRSSATILQAVDDRKIDWLPWLHVNSEQLEKVEEAAILRAKADLYDRDDDHRQDG